MISCKHCGTPNSLDSAFCKRCGTTLPEEGLAEARRKLDAIVAEGVTALNEGRLEEAMAVAESATAADPSSVPALALKANCHERRGEIADALECAERIVELNPDSELDKIKRNQLRNALLAHAQASPGSDPRFALVGAVAAIVLVVSLGALALRARTPEARPSSVAMTSVPSDQGATFGTGAPASTETATNPEAPSTANSSPTAPATAPQSAPANETAEPRRVTTPRESEPVLPPARATLPDPDDTELRPITPSAPPAASNSVATPKTPVKSTPSVDPDPTIETPARGNVAPPENPGQIEITVHAPSSRRLPGGSDTVASAAPSTGGARAYARVGNEQFQVGDYDGAAASLERALRSGGDATSLGLRLGQAYQRLGRNSDAAGAYQRCIQAVDSAIAAGRGDRERLKAVKESCESALRVVQG